MSVKLDMGRCTHADSAGADDGRARQRQLSWVVEQGSSFLYNVERHFRFDPLPDNRTHFVQSETSAGFLSPLIGSALFVPVVKGYRAFNQALKARVEERSE